MNSNKEYYYVIRTLEKEFGKIDRRFFEFNKKGKITELNLLGMGIKDLSIFHELSKPRIKHERNLVDIPTIHAPFNIDKSVIDIGGVGVNGTYDHPLSALRVLKLSFNGISDLSPLQRLSNLECLYLNGNRIKNLNPLQDLTNLNELDLSGNKIKDLSPLSGLVKLTVLDLSYNQISSLEPLRYLPKSTYIDIDGNPCFPHVVPTQSTSKNSFKINEITRNDLLDIVELRFERD
jgi:Leucine-rich repeat (LRR) protein